MRSSGSPVSRAVAKAVVAWAAQGPRPSARAVALRPWSPPPILSAQLAGLGTVIETQVGSDLIGAITAQTAAFDLSIEEATREQIAAEEAALVGLAGQFQQVSGTALSGDLIGAVGMAGPQGAAIAGIASALDGDRAAGPRGCARPGRGPGRGDQGRARGPARDPRRRAPRCDHGCDPGAHHRAHRGLPPADRGTGGDAAQAHGRAAGHLHEGHDQRALRLVGPDQKTRSSAGYRSSARVRLATRPRPSRGSRVQYSRLACRRP